MTKDVLVSISGKHIDIMEDPTAGYETGDDAIEVVTPASYYCKNGKHYIIYDEILEGKAGTIRNKIRITGNEMVEIMKSGAASSHMTFRKNQKNLLHRLVLPTLRSLQTITPTVCFQSGDLVHIWKSTTSKHFLLNQYAVDPPSLFYGRFSI